jgi:putative DNA primase/helicase
MMEGWLDKHEVDPAEIESWEKDHPRDRNTGLLTRSMPTLDIDLTDERAATRIQALAYTHVANAGKFLVRIGKPPKRAIPFRTDAPFRKITVKLYGPGDDRRGKPKQALEFLCDGQQVVCDGIHPETGKPYTWANGHPPNVAWNDLPYIVEEEARDLIEHAVELLIADHGYTLAREPPPEQPPGADSKGSEPWSEAKEKTYRSALAAIPTDEATLTAEIGDSHIAWVNVGRGIYHLGWGERGKAMWTDWSRGSEEFDPEGIDENWKSFGNTHGAEKNPVTIATVIYYAKKFGWKPSPESKSTLVTTAAADVEMQAVDWLWPDRFALGAINLIAGLPDMGKGQIAAFIAAAVTSGIPLPCDEGKCRQGSVIWLNAEDNASTTVIPRLVAAGADLGRIHFATATRVDGKDKTFSLVTDLPLLREAIERIGDVVLVIIDPISAYLGVGKVDSRQATDVRGVLTPLKELVEEFHFALLGIAHFNKKEDTKSAMLRVSDSIAYVAAARSVYVVFDDPNAEVPGQKLFIKAKNNIARDVQGLRYDFRIKEGVGYDDALDKRIDGPYINWGLEHVDMTANDAMAAVDGRKNSARREAQDFLRERLAAGPVDADEIQDEAHHEGISKNTLRRAKSELKIRSRKKKGDLRSGWEWVMPSKVANE